MYYGRYIYINFYYFLVNILLGQQGGDDVCYKIIVVVVWGEFKLE